MNYNYKYRLYPSQSQQSAMKDTLDTCRQLYNKLLEMAREPEYTNNTQTAASDLLATLKEDELWYKRLSNIHSRVALMVTRRLRNNISSATRPFDDEFRPDRLRFKGENWYKTFTYHQSGFKLHTEETWLDTVYLSKIGMVPIRYHREIPENAEIKQVTIKQEQSGEWYAIFGIEVTENSSTTDSIITDVGFGRLQIESTSIVGTDNASDIDPENIVSISPVIEGFLADSDGRRLDSLPTKDKSKSLARKKLARADPESNNNTKRKEKLARIREQEQRMQYDVLHKVSTQYAQEYDIILFEKRYLGYENELWWEFMEQLMYKAESAGTLFVPVSLDDEEDLECSECGVKSSRENWFTDNSCPSCDKTKAPTNVELESEQNTVFLRGANELGLGWSENKPVDTTTAGDAVSPRSVVESGNFVS